MGVAQCTSETTRLLIETTFYDVLQVARTPVAPLHLQHAKIVHLRLQTDR
jgi:hypothetical protein